MKSFKFSISEEHGINLIEKGLEDYIVRNPLARSLNNKTLEKLGY